MASPGTKKTGSHFVSRAVPGPSATNALPPNPGTNKSAASREKKRTRHPASWAGKAMPFATKAVFTARSTAAMATAPRIASVGNKDGVPVDAVVAAAFAPVGAAAASTFFLFLPAAWRVSRPDAVDGAVVAAVPPLGFLTAAAAAAPPRITDGNNDDDVAALAPTPRPAAAGDADRTANTIARNRPIRATRRRAAAAGARRTHEGPFFFFVVGWPMMGDGDMMLLLLGGTGKTFRLVFRR